MARVALQATAEAPVRPRVIQAVSAGFGLSRAVTLLLVTILLFLLLLSLAIGSVSIPLDEVLTIVLGGQSEKSSWVTIVQQLRLPRALTALLAGAALSVSGLLMQTFFRNPLAGPFVLGISSGASLGVALVVLSTGTVGGVLLAGIGLPGDMGLAFAASAGAAVSLLLVLVIARAVQSSMTLLVLGVLFGYMTSALVSLLLFFNLPERIQAYINWTFGSFNGVNWAQMQVMLPVVAAGLAAALLLAKPLNVLLLGEDYARSMGLKVGRARFYIIVVTALLAGCVTAFCGPIAFLGIAVPHLCRTLFNTSDHRTLLPASMLVGGIVALAAALIAQVPGSTLILPLNAVTALIGAPVVIWVILRRRNLQRSFAS